jgi:SAM-dependent methyltransferase
MRTAAKLVLGKLGVLPLAQQKIWSYRLRQQTPTLSLLQLPFDGRRSLRNVEMRSIYDFHDFRERAEAELFFRRQLENSITTPGQAVLLEGRDPLIGGPAQYYYDPRSSVRDDAGTLHTNVRESLVCLRTVLPSRTRAALLALYELIPHSQLKKAQLYLTEQTTPLFRYFRHNYAHVIGSEYLGPEHRPGSLVGGIRHEDLTRLSFRDQSLDVVVNLEILEHLPEYRPALSEMARVLRPGGLAIITTPMNPLREEHHVRAELGPDGALKHHFPPQYHYDPVKPEAGILCYRHFGWKLLNELREAGFSSAGALFSWDIDAGVLGEDLLVVYGLK